MKDYNSLNKSLMELTSKFERLIKNYSDKEGYSIESAR